MVQDTQHEETRTLTAELRFGVRLVKRFAGLSGDANPIHVDRIAARRLLYGERVTHGMLLALWTLACLRAASPGTSSIAAIAGSFKAPVRVGARARIVVRREFSGWHATVRSGGNICATFHIETRTAELAPDSQSKQQRPGEPRPRTQICHERPESDLRKCRGSFRPPEFDPRDLFAGLAGFNQTQCQMLAGLSWLVGMECPGLHSALLGFDVNFEPAVERLGEITFKTDKFDSRFKFLSLELSGSLRGHVECLLRPSPAEQLSMAAVGEFVPAGLFVGKHALVVGGSRGIGEVVAKGFAAGGGHCTLTYAAGTEDAARVAADINGLTPGMASTVHWDVAGPSPDLSGRRFTHAFFLASPPIRKGGMGRVDTALYRRYRRVYVAGLEAVLHRFASSAHQSSVFVFASSTFVESAPPGFAEYANAKRDGELICRQLGGALELKVKVWRLPPLRTDQTTALSSGKVEEVCPVVADLLKGLVSPKVAE